jgi:Protein of unknown function (DUF3489)
MAKTNRRTKAATDAHLTNTASERTPTPPQPLPHTTKSQRARKERSTQPAPPSPANNAPTHQRHTPPWPGSKQALLLSLLSRQQGACLAEMMEATGWLPHTTRAALTGLRQRGCTIERSTSAEGSSTYRLMNSTPVAAKGEKA